MATKTTRKQRIIRALTPRKIRRAQARWRRRMNRVRKARDKVRGIWFGDVVANGRRRPSGTTKTQHATIPAARPAATGPRPPKPRPTKAPPVRPKCDGTCTNSALDPHEAEAHGLCWACAGRKELVTNFGGRHIHVPCGQCSGTGGSGDRDRGGGATGNGSARPVEPGVSRGEAARKSGGWVGVAAPLWALCAAYPNPWTAAAAGGATAAGGLAYRHERLHGTPDHASRSGRKAARRAARDAGCSAACMWSLKPADTCRCPCGGSTHGIGHKRRAVA